MKVLIFALCSILSHNFAYAVESNQTASKCANISNADERLKCISEMNSLSSSEQVFCTSNEAVVVDHLSDDTPNNNETFVQKMTTLQCQDDLRFYLKEWKGDWSNRWGYVKVYRNDEYLTEGWIQDTVLKTKADMEQIRLLREKEKEQAVVKQREYEERERELDAERAELRKVQEAQEKERQQLEDKERKARELQIKKQPKNVQNIIRAGKIILGMNKDAVKLSWGEPDDINRTVFPGNVHEQWVYPGRYLYFENGILTSFQD